MYIELEGSSRGFSVTSNSIRQNFSYVVCDEEFEDDEYVYGEFFHPNDDIGIAKFVYETFPIYRTFPLNGVDDILLILTEFSADDLGDDRWKLNLTYSISADGSQASPSYVQFGVDLGGDTVHVGRSLEIRNATTRSGLALTPPVTYGVIGLTKNSVEGADILFRGMKFNITAYYAPSIWSPAVLNTWYLLTTCYNASTFYGFSPGEVQLQSISAQGEVYKKVPVTFNFLASPNMNGVADNPFTPLYGLGHDLVDYLYMDDVTNNYPVKAPAYRYVHRVYTPANFNLLGL